MSFLLLLACAPPEAEPGSMVLPSDDIAEPWDEAYAVADDVGGRFTLGAQVIGPDGQPAAGVREGVLSGWDGAQLVPHGEVHGTLVLDVRANEVFEIGPCGAGSTCMWLEQLTGADGEVQFDVFLDLSPDSGSSVPIFISSGDDVASVDIELVDAVVVH